MSSRTHRTLLAGAAIAALVAGGAVWQQATAAAGDPYMNASLPVADRVSDLMSRMSLDDKAGQMTQADLAAFSQSGNSQQDLATYRLGSVLSGGDSNPSDISATGWANTYDGLQRIAQSTSLQIPMIYGIDAVHGQNHVRGAVIFPHNIGLGATRDPALVQQVGRVTAEEVAATGVDWTFSPCLCVARNDRWGRTYESFGETPDLVTSMTTIVDGLQTDSLGNSTAILATAKHYLGDGGTTNGTDQGNTQISESELRAIHLPPFKAAVDRGVGSVMISYSSFNGAKMHGNKYLITDVLKGELGFSGFVVTDWAGIDQLDGATGFTASEVATAINAGIDMVMVPNNYKLFIQYLKQDVNNGQIPQSRIDDAVRRILTKKFQLGLFERPLADRSLISSVGSQAHKDVARQAVRESQVLLKNSNGVLPLKKSGKIFVAGSNANDIGNQSGGWTISWQGASGNVTTGTTILQGIQAAAGNAQVTYAADGSGIDSSYSVAVAVVGEKPYAEGKGDLPNSMSLSSTDLSTISRLRATGVPVVVVLVSGRPLDIASEVGNWAGLVASWLPGTEGGGVADVLFGAYNPTGKLPQTWPSSASQEPINSGDGKTGLYPFGYGLSYPTTTTTTTTTTTRPTTTTTTCNPTAGTFTSASTTSLTFTLNGCLPSSGTSRVNVYPSSAGGTPVATATGSIPGGTVTVTGLTPGTQYWYDYDGGAVRGPVSTLNVTTTTTTTCSFVNGTVTAVGPTSITFQVPGSTCIPQAIFNVTVYSDSAGTVVAGTGQGTRQNPVFTVGGLAPNTQYWYRFDSAPLAGPVRTTTGTTTTTTTSTTTTTCQPTGGTFLSATTTTLTFSLPALCGGGGAPGVAIYTSATATSPIGVWEGGTTATATGLTPGTQYWYRINNGSLQGPVSTLPATTTTTTTGSPSGCTAAYKVVSSWPGGFQGEVTVTATAPLSAWTVTWTLASGQTVQQAWNTTLTTSGTAVTAKNLSWNGSLGTGASATFGFIGGWSGSNPTPALTCRPS